MRSILSLIFLITLLTSTLTSCGFQLRGYDTPVFKNQHIRVQVENSERIHNKTSRNLDKHLTTKLLVLGATVSSSYSKRNKLNQVQMPEGKNTTLVKVDDIDIRKHRLVGTLTEVQLHMTANLTLNAAGRQPLTRRLQLQRSYQYNQATVNTANQQEGRIIALMHAAMADRIAQQVALYEQAR